MHASITTRACRWLLIGVSLMAMAALLTSVLGTSAGDRSFQETSSVLQLTISLLLPLVSILLITGGHTPATASTEPGRAVHGGLDAAANLLAGCGLAMFVAGCAIGVSALTTAVFATAPEAWRQAALVIVGGFLVQLISQLCGMGFALLLGSRWPAVIADFALPTLAVSVVTAPVHSLRLLRPWIEPYLNAGHLLDGQMNPQRWAQCAVVIVVWAVALPAAGVLRRRRRRPRRRRPC